MRGKKLFVILQLLISAVLFSLGVYKKFAMCNQEKTLYIAFIPASTTNSWYEAVHQGALKAAGEEKIQISWDGPEIQSDRERQIQILEDVIVKGADAVVIGPNDTQALARPIESVNARHIPCVVVDIPVATDKYDSFVATDNYLGGVTSAKLLAQAIRGRGKVLIIRYMQNCGATDERYRGFVETVGKDYPDIEILSAPYAPSGVEEARQKTVDLLTRYPDADAIFAVNQPVSIGAYKGIENQHLSGKVKLVVFDSDPVLLDGMQRGEIDAIVSQNPFVIGYQGVKQAVKALRGEKVERVINVPTIVVTPDNIEEMKSKYSQALGI